jgi:hypothetical protein
MQYTRIYMETQIGENHIMISYIYQEYIHRKHQLEGGTNPLIYRHQPEGNTNSLSSLAPTGRRLRAPNL